MKHEMAQTPYDCYEHLMLKQTDALSMLFLRQVFLDIPLNNFVFSSG